MNASNLHARENQPEPSFHPSTTSNRLPRLPRKPSADLATAWLLLKLATRRMLTDPHGWLARREAYLAEYRKWQQRDRIKRLLATTPKLTTADKIPYFDYATASKIATSTR